MVLLILISGLHRCPNVTMALEFGRFLLLHCAWHVHVHVHLKLVHFAHEAAAGGTWWYTTGMIEIFGESSRQSAYYDGVQSCCKESNEIWPTDSIMGQDSRLPSPCRLAERLLPSTAECPLPNCCTIIYTCRCRYCSPGHPGIWGRDGFVICRFFVATS